MDPNSSPASQLHEKQLQRERAARDAALGRRARSVERGDLGPVLKRWVSGSVANVATRLRLSISALAAGTHAEAAEHLASGVFGIPEMTGSYDLKPIIEWALKGDHLNDLVLAAMGTAISTLAHARDPVPLTRVLGSCAEAVRETCLGQFVQEVQGAKALLRVRSSGKAGWVQGKSLNAVALLLGGQVRGEMDDDVDIGRKQVVQIVNQKGDPRRIELRTPSPGDWALLEVARVVPGEGDPHGATWMSFAMIILCAAQAEAGWFDLASIQREGLTDSPSKRKRKNWKAKHGLVLSEDAYEAIKGDLDKWLRLGFLYEPMIVEPVRGDYLSVKHREVAGGRGPMGLKTHARDTAHWDAFSSTLARTPWVVPQHTLQALRNSEFVRGLAEKSEPDEVRRELILGAYRRDADKDALYMPLFLDFRGRVYTRPNVVTYQGRDLQKSLLVFQDTGRYQEYAPASSKIRALAMHMGALYGNGLDKAPLRERLEWLQSPQVQWAMEQARQGDWDGVRLGDVLSKAEEPLQLLTALGLYGTSHEDQIACQIDGTCNGLQHLSALFRDEEAAPYVNLVGGLDRPADLYRRVAELVTERLLLVDEPWGHRVRAALKIDRKLCKKPVMVLPYGGTLGTIEDAVLDAILGQDPEVRIWTHGWVWAGGHWSQWPDWCDGNYIAFQDRALKDHPLLHLDAKRLGGLVWDCITEVLPKAMAAMQTFRDIAKYVKDRTIEWDTGFHTPDHDSLWVTQAKAKSSRAGLRFKGLHLPNSVRGLSMRLGKDEIDPASHTSGIVANFIHSQDAAHLAWTCQRFGKNQLGAIHDCLITRPSLMGRLGDDVRLAFAARYYRDPLSNPVYLFDPKGRTEAFSSWHALAKAAGTEFPEDGKWQPSQVIHSEWFFS